MSTPALALAGRLATVIRLASANMGIQLSMQWEQPTLVTALNSWQMGFLYSLGDSCMLSAILIIDTSLLFRKLRFECTRVCFVVSLLKDPRYSSSLELWCRVIHLYRHKADVHKHHFWVHACLWGWLLEDLWMLNWKGFGFYLITMENVRYLNTIKVLWYEK